MSTPEKPPMEVYRAAWGYDPDGNELDPQFTTAGTGHDMDGIPSWRKPVTDDPWPFTPDNCGFSDYWHGHWTRDGERLVCAGCGLDGT